MTATYDASALASSAKDRIRFMIGDTDTGGSGTTVRKAYIEDEEIALLLSQHPNETIAAITAIRRILARIARDVDTGGAGTTTTRSQRTTQFRDALRDLEREGFSGAVPRLIGASASERAALKADPDFRAPVFEIGMDDRS